MKKLSSKEGKRITINDFVMTVISRTVKEVMQKHGGKHGNIRNPPSIGCTVPVSFHKAPKEFGVYFFGNNISGMPIRLKLYNGLASSVS